MTMPPISGRRMRKVGTVFNNPEYEKLVKYAKKKGLSLYGLVKKAVREYVERHP